MIIARPITWLTMMISGETDTVTSGSGEHSNKLLCVYRKKIGRLRSNRFRKLLTALQELEIYFQKTTLDVEFVIDDLDRIFLLQVRELATKTNWNFTDDQSLGIELEKANNQLKKVFDRSNAYVSRPTILGQMPDWNPAEVIGRAKPIGLFIDT